MIAALLLLANAAAGQVEARIAPDHPLRVVYMDEPLTLQITSTEPVRVRGLIQIIGKDGEPHVEALRAFDLKPSQPFLQTIDAFNDRVGYYRARMILQASGEVIDTEQAYCRLARPNPKANPRLAVSVATLDLPTLMALNAIPIKEVWVESDTPHLNEIIEAAMRADLRVAVRVHAEGGEQDESQAEMLGKAYGQQVSAWIVDAQGNPTRHNRVAEALTKTTRRRVIAAVKNPRALGTLLNGSAALYAHEFALQADAETLTAARRVAEQAGLEQPTFVVEHTRAEPSNSDGHKLVHALIAGAAGGARLTVVPLDTLAHEQRLTPGAVYLHAFAAQMGQSSYVGELPLGEGNYGAMFREDASWRVAYWSTNAAKVMQVRPGSAENVLLADSWNNPVAIEPSEDGVLRLKLDGEARYLSGQGGSVLAQAASTALAHELSALVASPKNNEQLPSELIELLKAEQDSKNRTLSSVAFITLLQSFPYLEKQSRDEVIDRSVAIPAMAALTRVLESACILKEERGEPFLEPPQSALFRCTNFRTEFVTNLADPAANSARTQWLLAEIGRLDEKARALIESGRQTEATGIAKLAEWRARSLEFTVPPEGARQ